MTVADDLTTLANVKQWLGLSAKTADDDLLQRMITAASGFIRSYISSNLTSREYSWTFNGNGKNTVTFPEFPATEISSVIVENVVIPARIGMTGAGYVFNGYQIWLMGYLFNQGFQNCQIIGFAGYLTVPPEIEQGCIEWVGMKYREKFRIGQTSASLSGESISLFLGDMPASMKTTLMQYKRVITVTGL